MERKEKILRFIKSKEYIPLKADEMKTVLGVPADDVDEFYSILDELELNGQIIKTKKSRYQSAKSMNMVSGVINCNSFGRYAFLIPQTEDDDEIFIPGDKLGDSFNSDTVLCAIDVKNPKNGKSEGHVVKVLKRGNSTISGVIKSINGNEFYIIPDSKKIYASIRADINTPIECNVGDRVLVEITDYPKINAIDGIITKNLGKKDELKSNIEAIIAEHSIKQEFDVDTLLEAKNSPSRVTPKEYKNRLDLRDEIIFTIDGDDARDFDDAVSLKIKEDGRYLLGVHIADVTHYVKEDSFLDKEAYMRGTSVYLSDRVIPMLPTELSNGICSLNPRVNRLALSVFINIDKNGNTSFEKLEKSVIRSCERLTYSDVATLLENPTQKLLKKYEYILPTLKSMHELSLVLNKRRQTRGSINFDFPEAKVIVDDAGKPVDIVKEERLISHKMIEEFMLLANETIAELAFWAELPFVYRVHEPPSVEKAKDFNQFLLNFGYSLKGRFDKDNPIHPKAFQQVLDKISGTDEENMISTYMLRSLMKAEYKPENLGHFGLSAKYYCHFTSPIRRYPDLLIHRILKAYIDSDDTTQFEKGCTVASVHSSDTEREAEYCERDVDDLMMCAFMSDKIGETFKAKVSSVTNFGVFVELENTVEGLIRLDSMKDDYYEFSEITKTILGKRHQKTYKIGDSIDVVLVKCELLSRQIDFVRAEDFKICSTHFERKLSTNKKSLHQNKRKHKNNSKNFLRKKRNKKQWKNSK